MSVTIYTGDVEKCRVISLMECPACGDSFDFFSATLSMSVTVGDKVFVCPKHGPALIIEEEIRVQTSLKKAVDNHRGHVINGQQMVKKSLVLEKMGTKLETVLSL